jgi:2-phosphosulfolactate phosphatase
VRIHVAFTPAEAVAAPVAIVVDVMRATSTIAQALASGWERVYCAPGIEEARALRDSLGEGLLGGERDAVQIPGFDLGASPREVREPCGSTLIMSTTNGTRAIVAAAASCETVLLGSLLNLSAAAAEARERGTDVVVLCAGYKDAFAIDDAYCAGRITRLLDGERTDSAVAAEVIAGAFATSLEGINARTYGPPGLEEDIAWVTQDDLLAVVPRFSRMLEGAAEIVAG